VESWRALPRRGPIACFTAPCRAALDADGNDTDHADAGLEEMAGRGAARVQ
jgi:hypothetical protein